MPRSKDRLSPEEKATRLKQFNRSGMPFLFGVQIGLGKSMFDRFVATTGMDVPEKMSDLSDGEVQLLTEMFQGFSEARAWRFGRR